MKSKKCKITLASLAISAWLALSGCGGATSNNNTPVIPPPQPTYDISVSGTELLNGKGNGNGRVNAYFIPGSSTGTLIEQLNTTPYRESPWLFIGKGEDFSAVITDIPSDLEGEVRVVLDAASGELIAEEGDHISQPAYVDSTHNVITGLDTAEILTADPGGSYAVSGEASTVYGYFGDRGNLYLVVPNDADIAGTQPNLLDFENAIARGDTRLVMENVGVGASIPYVLTLPNNQQTILMLWKDIGNDGLNLGDQYSLLGYIINLSDAGKGEFNPNLSSTY